MKHTLILHRVAPILRHYLRQKGYSSHTLNVFSGHDTSIQDTILFAKQWTDFIVVSDVQGATSFYAKEIDFTDV